MSDGKIELLTAVLVSIFGIVNVLITAIVSPITSEKKNNITFKKEKLYENAVDLVEYVSDAVRIEKPKQKILNSYRKYCLQVHLLFINGIAYDPEYYGAAEPPVRCGESHLSGLTEPLRSL